MRTRLAPTPSGYLHWGNLYNFMLTWVMARYNGGSILLRIDDIDNSRSRPEYINDIFETLRWLGFDWDEGPFTPDEFHSSYSQHHRLDHYRELAKPLSGYSCSCSRTAIAKRTGDAYDRHCFSEPHEIIPGNTWRWLSPTPDQDIVLWRKEDLPSYQLASLSDDLHFGITHIVRGVDLLESSRLQRQLAMALGSVGSPFLSTAIVHHKLLLDHQQQKLSKSAGSDSLRAWRETGKTPSEVFRELSRRAGLPPIASLDEALRCAMMHRHSFEYFNVAR